MLPLLADRGRRDREMHERAAALLEEVGLAARASYRAPDLGGEQQRVAIDRALVMRPPLVLAAEPTNGTAPHS